MSENRCPACNYENRKDNLYCTQCGQKLIADRLEGPRLLVLTNKKSSIVFQVPPGRSTIGRDIGNALVVIDDQASKYHAAIVHKNNTVWIEDLESKNGVFVEGKKITDRMVLPYGCLIKIGSTIMKFESGTWERFPDQ